MEGALKLARNATGKNAVIVFSGSFHGRTAGTMALTTSKTVYKMGPQLLPSGVYIAPYPYAYRLGMSEEQACNFALEAVEELLATQIAPSDVAANSDRIGARRGRLRPAAGRFPGRVARDL